MLDLKFFNAHHSPIGAFASFTLGYKGASGGLGLELAGPADQNLYIGIETGEQFKMLPFYGDSENQRERFDTSQGDGRKTRSVVPFEDSELKRDYKLSTDIWTAGDLTFSTISPLFPVPDPGTTPSEKCRHALIPAVFVEITVDNTRNEKERKAVFGYQGNDPYTNMRRLDDTAGGELTGIGQGRNTAICTTDKDVVSGLAFGIDELLFPKRESHMSFGLGTVGALIMKAAPGRKQTWRFVVCFHRGGIVTTGLDARYWYTRYFDSVEDVALYGCSRFDDYRDAAFKTDTEFTAPSLSAERTFMLFHAVRSYYGSTQLLEVNGEPVWVVNEGEYRMMNTFDLLVDHLFFELRMNPWTVRNALDLFVDRYSYRDRVRYPGEEKEHKGGVSFTHDMGVANSFSREGYSAYEMDGLDGCFSYMTHEQLVNWVLCGALYAHETGDDGWLSDRKDVFIDCFTSMLNRDHHDPSMRDGVMDLDSSRTQGGAEITTYDNVDTALGQARRNTYLAVKSWAAYLHLVQIFNAYGLRELSTSARVQADKCAETILSYMNDDGTIPALLQKDNGSVILSIIEGLIFAHKLKSYLCEESGPYSTFIKALRKHCETVLKNETCLFEDGGWRLSSTSENSWLSKIYLCQYITEKILGVKPDTKADATHLNWLLDPDNSYFSFSDQMRKGKVCGSRYYPRGVTSILWLET
ncbi:MAG: glycoside hydrolase family 52 protein [Chitinispirillaceae bacterium]